MTPNYQTNVSLQGLYLHVNGLVQDCRALAMELLQFRFKPSI